MPRKLPSRRNLVDRLRELSMLVVLFSIVWLNGCQGVSRSGGQEQLGYLKLASTNLNFGSVAYGSTKTLSVTATNTGNKALTLSNTAISTQYFTLQSPSLPVTLETGQSTLLNIGFSPNAAGSFSASASIGSDGLNSMVNISLSGTGTAGAGQLTVSPATMTAGNVVVGTGATVSGTLKALGADVTVTGVSTNNSVFTVGDLSLPITIASGKNTSFTITFSPQVTGTANATLTVSSNAQPATAMEALTGNGTAAPTHQVNLSWSGSTSPNIAGYNVYRALYTGPSCGAFSRINSTLDTAALYTDFTVTDGAAYCYATTAVNSATEESGYSNIVANVQIPPP